MIEDWPNMLSKHMAPADGLIRAVDYDDLTAPPTGYMCTMQCSLSIATKLTNRARNSVFWIGRVVSCQGYMYEIKSTFLISQLVGCLFSRSIYCDCPVNLPIQICFIHVQRIGQVLLLTSIGLGHRAVPCNNLSTHILWAKVYSLEVYHSFPSKS